MVPPMNADVFRNTASFSFWKPGGTTAPTLNDLQWGILKKLLCTGVVRVGVQAGCFCCFKMQVNIGNNWESSEEKRTWCGAKVWSAVIKDCHIRVTTFNYRVQFHCRSLPHHHHLHLPFPFIPHWRPHLLLPAVIHVNLGQRRDGFVCHFSCF